MIDERKLSTIRVVFANGGTEVFKDVEDLDLDSHMLRIMIADHTYHTQVPLDKVLYFEEVLDDNKEEQ